MTAFVPRLRIWRACPVLYAHTLATSPTMPRKHLPPEVLASIREAVVRGERELAAFLRGEGPAPGFEHPCTMPVDPTRPRPEPQK